MNKNTSVYLDLVRFTAAMTVFLGHLEGHRFTGGLFWQFGPFSVEAVDVFFVLSGFVIAYVADQRETTITSYSISRLARVYSVALPALITTFVLDAIGRAIRPELYGAWWGYSATNQTWQFLSSLFFANRLWSIDLEQGSNLSYWSLSYEVWYYVIFAAAAFSRGLWKVPATIAAMLVAGPTILSLFPLWLFGVACYRVCKSKIIGRKFGLILCICPIVVWIAYEVWSRHSHTVSVPALTSIFHRDTILQDYIISALFAVHLAGVQSVASSLVIPNRLVTAIRWAAGATFTIYLFHLPIAQFLTTILPWPPSAWITRVVIIPGVLVLMFLIAEVTERRKDVWRSLFSALITGRRALPSA